jgi:sporulation protein YlmC with PRC-barrel domain
MQSSRVLVRTVFASALLISGERFANVQAAGERNIAPAIRAENWNASDLIGQKVRTMQLIEVGKIRDLVMSPDGKIVYAAVSFEGFTKNGDKLYAVPMEAIYITWKDNKVELARIDVTEDKIKQLNAFDQNHKPLFADAAFVPKR